MRLFFFSFSFLTPPPSSLSLHQCESALDTDRFLLPPSLPVYVTVGRDDHSSVMLSDGSVLVMGGYAAGSGPRKDVWKTVDGGASWILVTSSAGWSGKKVPHLNSSLPLLPPLWETNSRRLHRYSVSSLLMMS